MDAEFRQNFKNSLKSKEKSLKDGYVKTHSNVKSSYEKKSSNQVSFVEAGKYCLHLPKSSSKKTWKQVKKVFFSDKLPNVYKIQYFYSKWQQTDMISFYVNTSLASDEIENCGKLIIKYFNPKVPPQYPKFRPNLIFKDLHGKKIHEIKFV